MNTPIILGATHSILNEYIAALRDENLQTARARFRRNLQRAGWVMAYEVSKRLGYAPRTVTTPLGQLDVPVLAEQPVLCAILRAALPMHQGFLDVFDDADNAFVSAYRHHPGGGDEFEVRIEYLSAPSLAGRTLVLIDPMIATGRSLVDTYNGLVAMAGKPKQLYICGLIASEEGVGHLQRHIPNADIFVAAIDSELTARGYIVPGLGDAGDLAYGAKA
jgi:uracil phosphoribosyltransferase